jgi:hypothetical protein
MSDYADQIWDWLAPPLRDLRESCRTEPELDWDRRFTDFLGALGLSSPEGHPVIVALAEHVEQNAGTDGERAALVADDRFETLVFDLVRADAAAYDGARSDATGQPPAAQAGDPAEVSEQAVLWFGLPALRDLAAARPDLLGRHGATRVTAALASVVVYRLNGQPLSGNDELSDALWTRIEGWLDGNPDVAARFRGVFDLAQAESAEQWVTYQLGVVAGEIATLVPEAPAAAPVTDPAEAARYEMPALVEQALRDVPDAAEALTPEEINAIVAEVLAESRS